MTPLQRTAHFRPEDDDRLVAASLACPWCLSADTSWELRMVPFDEGAECRCRGCGQGWNLAVTSGQALRLALEPAAAH